MFVGAAESYDCPGCGTRYHADCADELGGCATLGCPRLGVGPGDDDPDDQRWRARARRYREGARARRGSARRLREEHAAQAQEEGEEHPLVTAGRVGLDCLSCLVIFGCLLLTAGLVLAVGAAPERAARTASPDPSHGGWTRRAAPARGPAPGAPRAGRSAGE